MFCFMFSSESKDFCLLKWARCSKKHKGKHYFLFLQPNPSNKLAIIHILGLLSNLFTTLDISKQDDESGDGPAPPVKTTPLPPGPNPVSHRRLRQTENNSFFLEAFLSLFEMKCLFGFQVVVVLQQVFALIQNLLSKWLNDSQVVEVSHQYV